jgi:hypothetical protein
VSSQIFFIIMYVERWITQIIGKLWLLLSVSRKIHIYELFCAYLFSGYFLSRFSMLPLMLCKYIQDLESNLASN